MADLLATAAEMAKIAEIPEERRAEWDASISAWLTHLADDWALSQEITRLASCNGDLLQELRAVESASCRLILLLQSLSPEAQRLIGIYALRGFPLGQIEEEEEHRASKKYQDLTKAVQDIAEAASLKKLPKQKKGGRPVKTLSVPRSLRLDEHFILATIVLAKRLKGRITVDREGNGNLLRLVDSARRFLPRGCIPTLTGRQLDSLRAVNVGINAFPSATARLSAAGRP